MDALGFERVEEALHGCVVEVITLAAHRRRDAGSGEKSTIDLGGILNAGIGMMDEPWRRSLALDGHRERFQGDFGMERLAQKACGEDRRGRLREWRLSRLAA